MNPPEAVTAESRPAPGERLRAAREACNLSCEDVAERLRLSVAKIEALERSEAAGIVAPVYLAGYLRAYARLVDLEAEEIIDEFATLAELPPPAIDAVAGRSAKNYGKFGAELSTGISLGGGRRLGAAKRWIAMAVVLSAVIGAGTWWQQRDAEQATPRVTASDNVGVAPEKPFVRNEADAPAIATEEVVAAPALPAVISEPLAPRAQLVLTVVEESWVEIVDAQGHRLMHELVPAGQSHLLTGVAPFDIMLGYVAGVRLEYNGAPYDLSRFQNRRTAKFTVGASGDRMNID